MTVTVEVTDPQKLVEALLYVAARLRAPGRHNVSKMLYFADRMHLEHYGRMISGDSYIKMEYGPVPSLTYDLMKVAGGKQVHEPLKRHQELVQRSFECQGTSLRIKRDADLSYLSESEIECLDAAIAQHGHKSFGQLVDDSHDGAWNSVDENRPIPLANIVRDLPNAEAVAAYHAS
jgi:uncharacterized phage-associated protein